jgi:hypothetical protein
MFPLTEDISQRSCTFVLGRASSQKPRKEIESWLVVHHFSGVIDPLAALNAV